MLESHMKAKSYLIFSAIAILQQKGWIAGELWVVKTNSTHMLALF